MREIEALAKSLSKKGVKVYFEATVIKEITVGKKTAKRRREVVYGKCRKCGCTDFDSAQCIAEIAVPCAWMDDAHTLCSACA